VELLDTVARRGGVVPTEETSTTTPQSGE